MRVLVCAVIIEEDKGETSSDVKTPQSHRFVLPIKKSSTIHELCKKVAGCMSMKLEATVECEEVFTSGPEPGTTPVPDHPTKLETFFSELYIMENDQIVS